jgi:SAM-dependent methyltransferase
VNKKNYWSNSAESCGGHVHEELESFRKKAWQEKILGNAPQKETLKILDVGTGSGFFPIILGEKKHQVTGIDMAEIMIEKAKQNLRAASIDAAIIKMNALVTSFADESFDLIVSRNVTWTLSDPVKVYREWLRLLKKAGRLLIFDSNWFYYYFDGDSRKKVEDLIREYKKRYGISHDIYSYEPERDAYRRSRPLSKVKRPEWDAMALKEVGFERIHIENDIMDEVYDADEIYRYGATPLFMIRAEKNGD